MTFSDIFKSSFIEKITSFSALDACIAMVLAFAIGFFIFFVYKRTYSGVMYSASFGVSLIGMSLITALIILTISSNVVLSLGMVGALSIVRFRTAVKDPLDIVFLFWAISAGIVTGAGLIPLGVFGSVFIGVILLIFVNRQASDTPYMLVANCRDEETENQMMSVVQGSTKKNLLKTKTVTPAGIELAVEVRLRESSTAFINGLAQIDGVSNVSLVSFNGEYMS